MTRMKGFAICAGCEQYRGRYCGGLCTSCYDRKIRKRGRCVDCGKTTCRVGVERCQPCWSRHARPHLGHRHGPEAIAKIKQARSRQVGERHPMWKGGITPMTRLLRHTKRFQAWRVTVFERDDYTCQDCSVRGGKLHAHHIIRFNDAPQLRHVLSNGITLCADCHNKTKGKEALFGPRYFALTGFRLP